MKTILILSAIVLISCNKDVDGLLLQGTPADYSFTNADLEGVSIDESKVKQVQITSKYDGNSETLEALFVGNLSTISTDTVFLYFHGNLGNMNLYWGDVAKIANYSSQHKYSVLTFDYRGFGNSTGQSENILTMQADGEACIKWLLDQGMKAENLVLYGYSLGTLPTAHIAGQSSILKTMKLIFEAPQTSADVLIQDATGLSLTSNTISNFNYNIPEALSTYKEGFLWIHGTNDETANLENFEIFYNDYDNPKKEKYIVEGASHSIAGDIGFEKMEKLVTEFIRK